MTKYPEKPMEERAPKLKPPFIGVDTDTNEVVILESVAAVHREIEVYDVDEWELYDAEGRVINISAVEDDRKFLGIRISPSTQIRIEPSERVEPDRLHSRLRKYLESQGEPDPGPEAPVELMMQMVLASQR
jgi:hypothetical protein